MSEAPDLFNVETVSIFFRRNGRQKLSPSFIDFSHTLLDGFPLLSRMAKTGSETSIHLNLFGELSRAGAQDASMNAR